ncbi:uncharacterized protein LOC131042309 isoform X2 [Cryptomeria japonica]|uniref:uncharacterized protein LOC131042309 isoform X2 n=1 Tax=Cryptomeria japonica TaxID=3369 RepID=UPI0027DA3E5D|nr:uncharacterized protein LOC131042309 isoform X2 [Cryptomeria japonica]
MAAVTASASLQFIVVFAMVAFSAIFCQAIDKPTGEICKNSNDNSTVCQGVKGLKFSNVSMAGSNSSPRASSTSAPSTKSPSSTPATKSPSSTPATKSPTRGRTPKTPPSSNDGSDDNTKNMSSLFIVARPSLQALALGDMHIMLSKVALIIMSKT